MHSTQHELTQFDLFKKDDLMEVVYQSEEYYVGRHLDKETEHTFPAVQCDVLNPIPFEVREHSDEKKEMLKKPVSELKQKVEAAKQILEAPWEQARSKKRRIGQ